MCLPSVGLRCFRCGQCTGLYQLRAYYIGARKPAVLLHVNTFAAGADSASSITPVWALRVGPAPGIAKYRPVLV